MGEKLRQITDAVHQTIYLSELESEMMSTAYFYRLHDVYQSSTVYLAFPCNRTKRYEHSCGTMELAGQMCFYAIANADQTVLDSFFDEAEEQFRHIIQRILRVKRTPTYCSNYMDSLSRCFPSSILGQENQQIDKVVQLAFDNCDLIADVALDHEISRFTTDVKKRRFLYQCILESVRMVALFHDVGHPPYSHIMENVLNKLYDECKEDKAKNHSLFNQSKAEILIDSLSPFRESEDDNIVCLLSEPVAVKPHLHEQVGLKMLTFSFSSILKKKICKLDNSNKNTVEKSTLAAYYIAVAEFCMAILRETNPFFASLHRIIDGTVDADRMDYIVRDTRNSGVDWGKISYKRLLESCKLIKEDAGYFIAYPRKMAEDIDDALVARYKIFSRINFHHRVFKTSLILQRLVYLLSVDYLKKSEQQKPLCPNICALWSCLLHSLTSYNSFDLSIIQWNDTTLVSHLYQTLVNCKPNMHTEYAMTSEEYNEILYMLEEFLLNKKHFYSVFKRQSDFSPILKNVFSTLSSDIEIARNYEIEKLKADGTNPSALESIQRLEPIRLNALIEAGDIDSLVEIFPLKTTVKEIIDNVLFAHKTNKLISTYLLEQNIDRTKTGLPKEKDKISKGIYLYTSHSSPTLYEVSSLEKQIVQLQNNCLQYIAYIVAGEQPADIIKQIQKEIQKILTEEFKTALQSLFSCLEEKS